MLKKLIFVIIYALFHLLILREIRTALFSWQVNDEVIQNVDVNSHLLISNLDTRLVLFEYTKDDFHKFWNYKVPFGSFFFIGMIGLILLGAGKKYFLYLIGIHAFVLLTGTLIFRIDMMQHFRLLIITDLLSRYLIPLCSLGMIPLALIETKNSIQGARPETQEARPEI